MPISGGEGAAVAGSFIGLCLVELNCVLLALVPARAVQAFWMQA